MPQLRLEDCFAGVLLGTAVGDALGLPYEGMSRARVRRILGDRRLAHRFLLRRGMVSDDTDHACMVAEALGASKGDPKGFSRQLASKLRWWLLALPAGVGFATLRGITRLWLGISPEHSGVASAGNGPAMRAPLIGAYASTDFELRRVLVHKSTRLTHTDPRAEQGALAVAHAAAIAAQGALGAPGDLLWRVRDLLEPCEMAELVDRAAERVAMPTSEYADSLGLRRGITGFVNHTVPVVLHAWARQPRDLEPALTEVIRLGGDTDTTGAILGGLIGGGAGVASIPPDWLAGLFEWPRSVARMRRIARALANGMAAPSPFWPAMVARNLLFTAGVYLLLLRRAFPPYGER